MSFQAFKTYFLHIQQKFPNKQYAINCIQRFHPRDLNTLLANPCFVEDPTNTEKILQFKSMRASLGHNEKFICQKCPIKDKCQFNSKFVKHTENINVDHLTFYFDHLLSKDRPNFNDQFWFSALRTLDTYAAVIDDSINNNSKINQMLATIQKSQPEVSQMDVNSAEIGLKHNELSKDNRKQRSDRFESPNQDSEDGHLRNKDFQRKNRDGQEGFKRHGNRDGSEEESQKKYGNRYDGNTRGERDKRFGKRFEDRDSGDNYKYDRERGQTNRFEDRQGGGERFNKYGKRYQEREGEGYKKYGKRYDNEEGEGQYKTYGKRYDDKQRRDGFKKKFEDGEEGFQNGPRRRESVGGYDKKQNFKRGEEEDESFEQFVHAKNQYKKMRAQSEEGQGLGEKFSKQQPKKYKDSQEDVSKEEGLGEKNYVKREEKSKEKRDKRQEKGEQQQQQQQQQQQSQDQSPSDSTTKSQGDQQQTQMNENGNIGRKIKKGNFKFKKPE